ncbi:MAG: phosphate ABC transporter substrate-binding protein PstS [Meiothermus sp.]|nr:phosphate ABC transporter substrate-binding protein PstS [Meiothermus sp.]
MKQTLVVLALLLGAAQTQEIRLTGAGATFPQRLYTQSYFPQFGQFYGTEVSYQGVGSSRGIEMLAQRRVNFGASDSPMTNDELARARSDSGSNVLHIPTAAGGVAVIYNLAGLTGLRLDGETLVGIYLGRIARWDDPAIRRLNPNLDLPGLRIIPVHRSGGSGTNFIFTAYLSQVSDEWRRRVGRGRAVEWPVGSEAESTDELAQTVRSTPGGLGYIDRNAMPPGTAMAALRNSSGNFVELTTASVSKAVEGVDAPADLRLANQVVNTDHPQGYPIVGLTWILIYQEQSLTASSRDQAKALVEMLTWILLQGQQSNGFMRYAPLPKLMVAQAKALLGGVTFRGKAL